MGILKKISNCNTIPELDAIRLEVFKSMKDNNGKDFEAIQKAFIKKKNKLKRIPLIDRDWKFKKILDIVED